MFNHPEFCSNLLLPGLECGMGDLHFPEFGLEGDPRVEATIVYATGHVVGRNGRSGFGGHLAVGDTDNEVIGDGLTSPMGAEVILDILDHGAKDPGNVRNQIHEFVTAENSCNPTCADHQWDSVSDLVFGHCLVKRNSPADAIAEGRGGNDV